MREDLRLSQIRQIAVTVGADTLVLLSDVDGFYSGNPKVDPAARRFDRIDRITPEIEAMAGYLNSQETTGEQRYITTCAGCNSGVSSITRSRSRSSPRRRRG